MGPYILNSYTLKQVGIRLLPGENLEVAVALQVGLTEELEQSHATLLLTNKRLIRYSGAWHKANVVSVALDDIDSVEVNRTEKNRQWVWVSMVFVAGGALLGLLSLFLFSSPLSPLLMAMSLVLIGVVFYLTYAGGSSGEVIIRVGMKDIKCKMQSKALDDMAKFVQRVYELKLGYSNEDIDMLEYLDSASKENPDEGDPDDPDEDAVPTKTPGSTAEV